MPIQLLSRSRLNSLMAEMMPDHDIVFAAENGDGTWSGFIAHHRKDQNITITALDHDFDSEVKAIGAALARATQPREDFPGRVATKDDLRRW